MTSSYRATGAASVRVTPAAQVTGAGAWTLHELGVDEMIEQPTAVVDEQSAAFAAEEAARMIDEAYARGLADGERRGAMQSQAQVRDALSVIEKIGTELRETASLAPAVLEENIAALAVLVARQIVAQEVRTSREIVADLVRRALTEFPLEQSVRIRVNPMDLSLLTTPDVAAETTPIAGTREATWLADPRVSRGGCLIEGRDRIVDGRVDTALERAYRRLAQVDAS
jgi:flagellar biosynthesis/type III secretory pathway protein FliH